MLKEASIRSRQTGLKHKYAPSPDWAKNIHRFADILHTHTSDNQCKFVVQSLRKQGEYELKERNKLFSSWYTSRIKLEGLFKSCIWGRADKREYPCQSFTSKPPNSATLYFLDQRCGHKRGGGRKDCKMQQKLGSTEGRPRPGYTPSWACHCFAVYIYTDTYWRVTGMDILSTDPPPQGHRTIQENQANPDNGSHAKTCLHQFHHQTSPNSLGQSKFLSPCDEQVNKIPTTGKPIHNCYWQGKKGQLRASLD